LVDDSDLDQHM